jgi:hypothetical protein
MKPGVSQKFSLRHAIAGRIRVKVTALLISEDQAQALTDWLATREEVQEVQVHPLSRIHPG